MVVVFLQDPGKIHVCCGIYTFIEYMYYTKYMSMCKQHLCMHRFLCKHIKTVQSQQKIDHYHVRCKCLGTTSRLSCTTHHFFLTIKKHANCFRIVEDPELQANFSFDRLGISYSFDFLLRVFF